jgi:integrase
VVAGSEWPSHPWSVQEWMGHADVQTTMRYLHYAPRADDAALVAEAFRIQQPAATKAPA